VFSESRFRIGGIATLILVFACAAAPARAALPTSWAPFTVAPSPALPSGSHFGESIANAGDLDGDGRDDIVVGAPDFVDGAPGSSSGITGRVYALGSNGAAIWDAPAAPPSPQAANNPTSSPTRFGAQVARLGDIGQCLSTGDNCTTGAKDGIPEILVSAPGTDTGGGAAGTDQGAVYVLDGATGRILKQVQLSAGERPSTSAGFGKSIAALGGQPPCIGAGSVGDCPYDPDGEVALGDVNGGGKPDFIVGAPDFTETNLTREDICVSADVCPGVGRVYVLFGEAISGSSAQDSPMTEIEKSIAIGFPGTVGADERPHFGAAVAPMGDVGRCVDAAPSGGEPACLKPLVALTANPDGQPELAVGAPGFDLAGATDAGAAFLIDPSANAVMARIDDPAASTDGAFGSVLQATSAVGDAGRSGLPDLLVGSPGSGRALAFDGNPTGPALIANLTGQGRFGQAVASIGDVAADAPTEIAIGATGGGGAAGAVHIASACAPAVLKTLSDGDPAGRFGSAIAPIGDRNDDGFIDLAVGAPGTASDSGSVQVFTSTGPASAFAGCGGPVDPGDPGGGGGGGGNPGGGPTKPAPKVNARVLRKLVLVPNRRRLSRFAALRFKGSLKATAGNLACQRRQKIAMQRRKLKGGRYQTFDVAVTTANGAFTLGTRPSQSFLYRARVSQTSGCMGATSKAAKVVVRRR
jgi:hypothetical protein